MFRFLPLLLLFLAIPAHSQGLCSNLFLKEVQFEANRNWGMDFNKVEVYRRNNDYGLQQFGKIKLKKWFEIDLETQGSESYIGLNQKGQILHITKYPSYNPKEHSRTIAWLLSGEKKSFTDFYVSQRGFIAAVDAQSRVHIYNPLKWFRHRGLGSTVAKGLGIWSGVTALGILSARLAGIDIPSPFLESFFATATGLQTALVMLNRYQHNNTFPDGFVKTPLLFKSVEQLNKDISQNLDKLSRDPSHFKAPKEDTLPPLLPEMARQEIE